MRQVAMAREDAGRRRRVRSSCMRGGGFLPGRCPGDGTCRRSFVIERRSQPLGTESHANTKTISAIARRTETPSARGSCFLVLPEVPSALPGGLFSRLFVFQRMARRCEPARPRNTHGAAHHEGSTLMQLVSL